VLTKLKPRKIFIGPAEQLDEAIAQINRQMKEQWENDWSELDYIPNPGQV